MKLRNRRRKVKGEIKFFDFKEAETIRLLEPKEKHIHFYYDLKNRDTSMLCTGADKCPVCEAIVGKKTVVVRLKIFVLDIVDAFRRLFRN